MKNKLNSIISIILSSIITVTLLTACAKTESVAEETTVSETTAKYSDEELELMAQDMPEIVFVMSHHYDSSNIRGLYVTNKGEVKMYDFNSFAPSETYDIEEVYDKIEEAECSELYINSLYTLTQEDMFTVPQSTMLNYYKTLLKTDGNIQYKTGVILHDDEYGTYKYYGIRNTEVKNEVILLSGSGNGFDYYSDNTYSIELDDKLKSEIFIIYILGWSEETD